jgi:hypothetical protein
MKRLFILPVVFFVAGSVFGQQVYTKDNPLTVGNSKVYAISSKQEFLQILREDIRNHEFYSSTRLQDFALNLDKIKADPALRAKLKAAAEAEDKSKSQVVDLMVMAPKIVKNVRILRKISVEADGRAVEYEFFSHKKSTTITLRKNMSNDLWNRDNRIVDEDSLFEVLSNDYFFDTINAE